MATAYLVRTTELAETRERANHLHGVDIRGVEEQAKGMLANAHHIIVDEAFRRVRSHGQDDILKLLAVCR